MANTLQPWRMFLNHLENAADEDIRHTGALIQRDRYIEGIHEKEIRKRLESGEYGATARRMWELFKRVKQ